jgi:hypothetical protein
LRAAELSIKTSCVGEALSVPALAASRERVDGPLVRAVLDRLLRDEGPHARVGAWFLEWCAERLSSDDRKHLAGVALDAIEVYAAEVLAAAKPEDTVTVVNLLSLVSPGERGLVFDRLAQLFPPPSSVDKTNVVAGDARAIGQWQKSVVESWMSGETTPR